MYFTENNLEAIMRSNGKPEKAKFAVYVNGKFRLATDDERKIAALESAAKRAGLVIYVKHNG